MFILINSFVIVSHLKNIKIQFGGKHNKLRLHYVQNKIKQRTDKIGFDRPVIDKSAVPFFLIVDYRSSLINKITDIILRPSNVY